MYKIVTSLFILFLLYGCAMKQVKLEQSATIVLKTPKLKFYDQGFITKYDDHIDLQIFNAGKLVLNLSIYENRVCQSTLECLSHKEFNKAYLTSSYEDKFLYKLFSKKDIRFKDRKNNILIKVIKKEN